MFPENYPKLKNDIFYEGDFEPSKRDTGVGSFIRNTSTVALGSLYVYRGLKGAGWFPFTKKFWKPLSEVGKENIVRSFYRTGINKEITEGTVKWDEAIAKELKRGVGLSSLSEGVGRLFGRTIEGIPEFLNYIGAPEKVVRGVRVVPRKILGGSISAELGLSRGSEEYYKKVTASMAAEGVKPIIPSAPRILGRLAIFGSAVYAGTLAFNYLDYRLRRSESLDKTPLREGITGMAATAWVNSRVSTQKFLKRSHILELNDYLEDLMPGYLRVAGIAAGTAIGIAAGMKMPGKGINKFFRVASATLPRALALGVAGYGLERFLSYEPEDLEKIYSGEKKLPVRSGRFWEFGRSQFEGGKPQYYRQHWYPMMMSKYAEKGTLYPSEDWKWQHHWLVGPLTTGKIPDPYAWEKEYYYERPYPITRGIFEDVPIIGPTLQATVGRLIKPRKYMHSEELVSDGNLVQQPNEMERIRRVPIDASERLGLTGIERGGMGEVVDPDSIKNLLGEQQYRFTEWFGLPGFIMQEMYRSVTGKETPFENATFQSPSRATGFERSYWDRDLGGLLGTTEIFRRFFPHRRRQVEEYNPIENLMAKRQPWLPGPEYFIDFKHGDPFIKVPMGEARLPGEGYEALNELHSGIPGVYDAMDRFLILADVAPYSDQFKHYSAIVSMWSRSGVLDEKWTGKYKEAVQNRQSLMERYEFHPRRFSRIQEQVSGMLSSSNQEIKEEKDYSATERAIGKSWENMMHSVSNIPVPGVSWIGSKLIHQRTALEHYERYQIFGRESSFWAHPIRDFAKVYAQEIGGIISPDKIPSDVTKRWDIEEYFDRLQYVKYKQLESIASRVGDRDLAQSFFKKQKETMFGLNPYGGWQNIFRAMPKRERDYFEEFRSATGEERNRIRQIISRDMSRIYEARWSMEDMAAKRPTDTEKVQQHRDEELESYFSYRYLPGPNWIGWHPDVDLNKVKLKVVKNEAMDIHDFNLWESDEREMSGEPIPNIENYTSPNPQYDTPYLRKILLDSLLERGIVDPNIEITTNPSNESSINMDLNIDYDQSDRYSKSFGRRSYMMSSV